MRCFPRSAKFIVVQVQNWDQNQINMVSSFWIIITLSSISAGEGQTVVELCQSALKVDCEVGYQEQGNETLCASNLITYKNQCYFVKEKCVVSDLTISYLGPCIMSANVTMETPTASPTVAPTPAPTLVTSSTIPLDEWEILKRVFCTSSADISCGSVPNSICGSNRKIYFNDCRFAKAKCLDDSLTILPLNKCSTSIVGRRKRSILMQRLMP